MMKKSYLTKLSPFAALTLLVFFTGCSSSGISTMSPHEKVMYEKVISENTSPDEMIGQAQKRLQEAREAELDFYAPGSFKRASELLNEANTLLLTEGTKPEPIIIASIKAGQMIDSAFETKKQVLELLVIAISEKNLLDELNTQSIFPTEYASTMSLMRQMIDLIEEKKPAEATGLQPLFTEKTAALRVKTLDKTILEESRKILGDARNKEARRYAPKTYVTAELQLKQAEAFIHAYPRDREGIEKIGKETLKAATHAANITSEVKMISAFETSTIEGFVLGIEKQIHNIGESLNQTEIPYDTLQVQLEGLKESAASIAASAGRVQELERTKESLGTDLKMEKENADALKEKITGLEMKLEDTEKKLARAEALKTRIQPLEEAKKSLEEKINALQSDKNRGLDEIGGLKETVKELKAQLENAAVDLKQAEKEAEHSPSNNS